MSHFKPKAQVFEEEVKCPRCNRMYKFKGPFVSHLMKGHGMTREEARGYLK
jgi:uncharacterized C2H2 Zn-finger protein